MNYYRVISFLFIMICFQSYIYAQGGRKYIRQGNKEYEKDLYQESEVLYRKSLDKDQSSFEANFNLGDALYKQDKYEDATRRFSDLANEKTNKMEHSRIYHNLGNSLLNENRLEESIEAYKNALRNNPGDQDTKHNLAYAMSMLQQQQQQDQQQQRQQQDQNNQDQQRQQQQDQEKKDQEQQENQISEEDANRILEAMQQDEQKLLEELNKQKAKAVRVTVLKDW